ncbi:Uncharacterised protein [Mycobacteroides abscessus subsp. massiliense]|nr:Uncharacterised protein [Mycobacteroides abscessus subsp. massiliense]
MFKNLLKALAVRLKPVKVHAVQALFLKQAKANVAKANAVQPWKKLTLKKAKHLKPKLPK